MKWLIACLAVLFMVTPAMAGTDLYVAVVGNDIDANTFYLSPKYQQFPRQLQKQTWANRSSTLRKAFE